MSGEDEMEKLKDAIEHLKKEKEWETTSKLNLAKELSVTQKNMEVYIKKILSLQVTNRDLTDKVEKLELALVKSERAETERFEEVRMQAQRLMEAEAALEQMEKDMANMRAPSPLANHTSNRAPLKNFSFGSKLKGLLNTKHGPALSKDVQEVLLIPGNGKCADCSTTAMLPTWVSITYKLLLCTRCASIHRGMGTHISKIRSLTLDEWSDDELLMLKKGGNRRGNEQLLAKTPADFNVPSSHDEFKDFIHDKYMVRRYEKDGNSYLPPKYEEPAPGSDWLHHALHKLHDIVHHMIDDEPEPDSPVHHHTPASPKRTEDFVPSIKSWQVEPVDEGCDPLPAELKVLQEDMAAIGPAQRAAVVKLLPFTLKNSNWIRVFSSIEHGSSLRTLYEKCKEHEPNLLVIRTTGGALVGGFTMQAWEEQRYYHGTGQGFVFRFDAVGNCEGEATENGEEKPVENGVMAPGHDIASWRWSKKNEYFTLSHAGMLAFGGGSGPALCVNQSLSRGSTDACETYDCPPMLDPPEFVVQRLEVWTFEK